MIYTYITFAIVFLVFLFIIDIIIVLHKFVKIAKSYFEMSKTLIINDGLALCMLHKELEEHDKSFKTDIDYIKENTAKYNEILTNFLPENINAIKLNQITELNTLNNINKKLISADYKLEQCYNMITDNNKQLTIVRDKIENENKAKNSSENKDTNSQNNNTKKKK